MNIFEKLKKLGFDTVPPEFYSQNIDVWKSWYIGDVRKFHEYRVYNGSSYVKWAYDGNQ